VFVFSNTGQQARQVWAVWLPAGLRLSSYLCSTTVWRLRPSGWLPSNIRRRCASATPYHSLQLHLLHESIKICKRFWAYLHIIKQCEHHVFMSGAYCVVFGVGGGHTVPTTGRTNTQVMCAFCPLQHTTLCGASLVEALCPSSCAMHVPSETPGQSLKAGL
jgi:hypothetical protein